jgi:hypothetical protein
MQKHQSSVSALAEIFGKWGKLVISTKGLLFSQYVEILADNLLVEEFQFFQSRIQKKIQASISRYS